MTQPTTPELKALCERLRRKEQRLPPQGGGGISSNGEVTSYITDDGRRLVNPDGPAAADALEALGRPTPSNATLREALEEAREAIASLPEDAFGHANMPDRWTGAAMCYSVRDELLARIDAALASPAVEVSEGWLPIETAPKDGREVLLFENGAAYAGSWDMEFPEDSYWRSNCGQSVVQAPEPSHWRPLPEPPASQEQR